MADSSSALDLAVHGDGTWQPMRDTPLIRDPLSIGISVRGRADHLIAAAKLFQVAGLWTSAPRAFLGIIQKLPKLIV